jgi:chromosome segregation ATPase
MANLTKTQIKAKVKNLIEQISTIRMELEELQSDVEMERDDIEPYEGKDDLTEAQEERQEWLDNAASQIEEMVMNLQEAEDKEC